MSRTLSFLLCVCLVLPQYVNATPSNSSRGNISDEHISQFLNTSKFAIDTDANAVVLYENDHVLVTQNNRGGFVEKHHVYRLIKIMNAAGVGEANVSAQYYSRSGDGYTDEVKGATYNEENGVLIKTKLEKDAIYNKTLSTNESELVFALPNVKAGSVIEYSFQSTSPLMYSLPPWLIQGKLPKLHSEYEVEAPRNINYTCLTVGNVVFVDYNKEKDALKDTTSCYHIFNAGVSGTFDVIWGKRNIPAMKEEPFISCIENHAQRMDLQLSEFNRDNVYKENILTSWAKLDKFLMEHEHFGKQIDKRNGYLGDIVDTLTKHAANDLEKVKNIYSYVRANFDCNDRGGIYTESLKTVFENKRGSAAEINLLLTAMLKYADFDADPEVLSTKGSLRLYENYPLLNRLNYVVVHVLVGHTQYLLDASDKDNTFNILPPECYNGYARIINNEGSSMYLTGDDIDERNIFVANVSGIFDSCIKIEVTEKLGIFQSSIYRKKWRKDTASVATFVKSDINNALFTEIDGIEVKNLDNPDTNLIIKYTLYKANKKNINTFYFNADINRPFKENLFKEPTRMYPIELPYKMNYRYVMTLKLPDNVTADDIPKSTSITYEKDQMVFEHLVNYDSTSKVLRVNADFRANKTVFDVSAYETMREFFEDMITEENKVITFKKS